MSFCTSSYIHSCLLFGKYKHTRLLQHSLGLAYDVFTFSLANGFGLGVRKAPRMEIGVMVMLLYFSL